MKKRPEQTKEQRKKDIRFIRFGPIYFKRFKKLMPGRATKETIVMALAALWSNLGKITFKIPKLDKYGYHVIKENKIVYQDKKKYKNIPQFGRFNKYPRKILAGIYGSTLQIARKEGLLN